VISRHRFWHGCTDATRNDPFPLGGVSMAFFASAIAPLYGKDTNKSNQGRKNVSIIVFARKTDTIEGPLGSVYDNRAVSLHRETREREKERERETDRERERKREKERERERERKRTRKREREA
jgi:hypothetical protein